MRTVFTSESVTEGHPDKLCDQISDAVLDAILEIDPMARVACETCATTGLVLVMGEITTTAYVAIDEIARQVVKDIGYTSSELCFDGHSCAVLTAVHSQSPDIAMGVDRALETRADGSPAEQNLGAGDQGMMFGFACDETPELMPLPISLAHRLTLRLTEARKTGALPWLRPDGKSQVTVVYEDDRPVAVTDEQRAAILHEASRAPSAGAMMMYSIVSIREQATLDRLADLCDHQPMIAKAPWALIFVVDYAKWIDLFEHVGCFEPEFVERTGKAPRRAPGLGDFAIAAQDAVIAAQNAVVAAEALGLGSCYIGDIVENAEEVAELLDLPPYTMPLSMLIIGTPRKERPAIAHPVVNLVHEERYCRADAATMDAQVDEMDAMFRPHAREVGERVVDIYTRKHTSPFMAEMSRSMEWWFKNWLGK